MDGNCAAVLQRDRPAPGRFHRRGGDVLCTSRHVSGDCRPGFGLRDFSDPTTIRTHLNDLSSFLPGGAIEVIGDQLGHVASGGKTTLGAMFVFTIGLSLWSANAGMKALFDALNIVCDAEERRGLIKLNAVSLAFTAGALLVLLLAIAAIVVLPVALEYAGLQTIGGSIVMLARWPALFALVVVALTLIYRFGPDRVHAQWHWVTWGSGLAA